MGLRRGLAEVAPSSAGDEGSARSAMLVSGSASLFSSSSVCSVSAVAVFKTAGLGCSGAGDCDGVGEVEGAAHAQFGVSAVYRQHYESEPVA